MELSTPHKKFQWNLNQAGNLFKQNVLNTIVKNVDPFPPNLTLLKWMVSEKKVAMCVALPHISNRQPESCDNLTRAWQILYLTGNSNYNGLL